MGSGKGRRPKPARLGEKLRTIRESLGLSQSQMPKALGLNDELTQGMVSSFESNDREPSLIVLLAYAHLGNVLLESIADDKLELSGR